MSYRREDVKPGDVATVEVPVAGWTGKSKTETRPGRVLECYPRFFVFLFRRGNALVKESFPYDQIVALNPDNIVARMLGEPLKVTEVNDVAKKDNAGGIQWIDPRQGGHGSVAPEVAVNKTGLYVSHSAADLAGLRGWPTVRVGWDAKTRRVVLAKAAVGGYKPGKPTTAKGVTVGTPTLIQRLAQLGVPMGRYTAKRDGPHLVFEVDTKEATG